MKESAVERINRQFQVLTSSDIDFLIRDYIEPHVYDTRISLENDVYCPDAERSPKAQKFFNYCKQYVAFYKSRSYQFLFFDYSLGRFDYSFDNAGHLVSYNLYWNPCPISSEYIEEIEQCDMDFSEYIDNIDENERVELDNIILRTPIRFDYESNYTGTHPEYHPAFHMHFQHKNTRIKTQNFLSLYSYILFILENCYPDLYSAKEHQSKIEKLKKLDNEARLGFSLDLKLRDLNYGSKIQGMLSMNIH